MTLKKKTANIKHSQTLGSKNLIVKFNSFEEQLFKRKQELRKIVYYQNKTLQIQINQTQIFQN